MKSIFVISFISLLALLNCSNADLIEVNTKKRTIDKRLLLKLVNELRVKGCKCGSAYYPPVSKVVWSSVLEEVSLGHSMDMAKNNYFSHKAKDGSMTQQRLERVGYNWQSYGENIYHTGGFSATEEDVIKAWRESPGHCSNLMGKHFKEMGIAEQNDYWTQVFGSQM